MKSHGASCQDQHTRVEIVAKDVSKLVKKWRQHVTIQRQGDSNSICSHGNTTALVYKSKENVWIIFRGYEGSLFVDEFVVQDPVTIGLLPYSRYGMLRV